MPELILSAFSDEYAESLERQCEALAKFGIGYMEIRRADGKNVSEFTGSEAERVRKTLDAWGIRISSVGSPLGKTLPSEVSEEQIERVFTTAEILGAKYVRVFSFYLPEGAAPEQCRGQVIAGLEKTTAGDVLIDGVSVRDVEPGDRESDCGSLMEPVAVWVRKNGEWAIIHRCRRCGKLDSNRVAADDNPVVLMSIAVRPLGRPPFPIERMAELSEKLL